MKDGFRFLGWPVIYCIFSFPLRQLNLSRFESRLWRCLRLQLKSQSFPGGDVSRLILSRGRWHDDSRVESLTKTYNIWEYGCRKPLNRVFLSIAKKLGTFPLALSRIIYHPGKSGNGSQRGPFRLDCYQNGQLGGNCSASLSTKIIKLAEWTTCP